MGVRHCDVGAVLNVKSDHLGLRGIGTLEQLAQVKRIVVTVEEAYTHCSTHSPPLQPVPRTREWGTDDPEKKGGDYFRVAADRRTAVIGTEAGG